MTEDMFDYGVTGGQETEESNDDREQGDTIPIPIDEQRIVEGENFELSSDSGPGSGPVDPLKGYDLGTVMEEIGKGRCFALVGWGRKYVRAAGVKEGRVTMEMVYLPGSREWPDGRVERCRSLNEGPYVEVFPE